MAAVNYAWVYGNTVQNGSVYVYWSLQRQDQANNRSLLQWIIGWYFQGPPYDRQLDGGYLAINNQVLYNVPGRVRDYPLGGTGVRRVFVAYGEVWIPHNAQGFANVVVNARLIGYFNAVSQIINATYELPRIPRPPNPPTKPNVTLAGNTATIKWTSQGNNGAPITAWHLYRAENPQFTVGKVGWDMGTATTKVDSGLEYRKTYYYQVFAISPPGNVGSEVTTVTLGDAVPNTSPMPTVSNILPDSATLSWNAATVPGGATAITNYDVEIRKPPLTGTPTHTNVGLSRTLTVTGLEPGTTYYARVRAKNAAGAGNWSTERAFTTQQALYIANEAGDAWLSGVPYMVVNGVWRPVQFFVPVDGAWK